MTFASLQPTKGNLLIGQSGGPTAVINATLAGVLLQAHEMGFQGQLFGMSGGIEGFLAEKAPFDLTQLSVGQLEQLRRTSGAALGSCRYNFEPSDFPKLLALFQQYNIRYFFYIGGNGSMRTPFELDKYARAEGYALYSIGLPKTVDNDMAATDHTPGYGSAVRWLAQATQDSGLDLYTMRGFDHFKLIEAMGRHSGWLAAASLLARQTENDPPHIVLVPEQAFDEAAFLAKVERIYKLQGCILTVAAEGLRNQQGQLLAELHNGALQKDAIGKPVLSVGEGVAGYLCNLVSRELGIKARYDKPGTLQRGAACVSVVDRQEAEALGRVGLRYALEGRSGVMPGLVRVSNAPYYCKIEPINLAEVVGYERKLPPAFLADGEINEQAFKAYAAPLIGAPLDEPFKLNYYSNLQKS